MKHFVPLAVIHTPWHTCTVSQVIERYNELRQEYSTVAQKISEIEMDRCVLALEANAGASAWMWREGTLGVMSGVPHH